MRKLKHIIGSSLFFISLPLFSSAQQAPTIPQAAINAPFKIQDQSGNNLNIPFSSKNLATTNTAASVRTCLTYTNITYTGSLGYQQAAYLGNPYFTVPCNGSASLQINYPATSALQPYIQWYNPSTGLWQTIAGPYGFNVSASVTPVNYYRYIIYAPYQAITSLSVTTHTPVN